jgi:transcriptional regulator with XRE-family HTH domain
MVTGLELKKGNQIAAARALLGWDQKDIAERVGVTVAAISKIEKGDSKGKSVTLEKIHAAFEGAGVEFTKSGVRLERRAVRVFEGLKGFIDFFDEVYWHLKETRNPDVCISNVDENQFDLMPRTHFEMHKKRILALNLGVKYKVLTRRGDLYFPAAEYAEYRWSPEGTFFSVPHYIYGDRIAMMLFGKNPRIYILNEKEITDMYRRQFEEMWGKSIKPVGKVVTVKPEHESLIHK